MGGRLGQVVGGLTDLFTPLSISSATWEASFLQSHVVLTLKTYLLKLLDPRLAETDIEFLFLWDLIKRAIRIFAKIRKSPKSNEWFRNLRQKVCQKGVRSFFPLTCADLCWLGGSRRFGSHTRSAYENPNPCDNFRRRRSLFPKDSGVFFFLTLFKQVVRTGCEL